jgi:flagellin-like protein
MKANRKFVEGDEAVSAVIGVILMVAITVAIAATVYVYVSGMIGVQQRVPVVQMLAQEDDDRLTVINTDADVDWENLAIRSTENVWICVNGEVGGATSWNLTANTYHQFNVSSIANYIPGDNPVRGSDFIDIESHSTTTLLNDVTITFVHGDTDTVLGTYTYASIAPRV